MNFIKDVINCNFRNFSKAQLALLALLVYVFAFFASTAQAKDYQLTKSEFLSRFESGGITLEKSPALAMNPEIVGRLLESMKKEWPGFKDEMFYISYVKSNDFTYFLFFEWYDRGCVFGVTQPKKYQGNSDKANGDMAIAENKSYEKVDKKYCEKALGISLPASGLSKIPGAIKPIKPTGKGIK